MIVVIIEISAAQLQFVLNSYIVNHDICRAWSKNIFFFDVASKNIFFSDPPWQKYFFF